MTPDLKAMATRYQIRFAEEAELTLNQKTDFVCEQIAASAFDARLTENQRAQARRDLEALDPAGAKARLARHAEHHPNLRALTKRTCLLCRVA